MTARGAAPGPGARTRKGAAEASSAARRAAHICAMVLDTVGHTSAGASA